MQVVVQSESPDQLRDLYAWLTEEPELRGRVQVAEEAPQPGTMGAPIAALEIVLASGKLLATMSTALVSWLRTRSGEVSIKLTRGEQAIEVTAKGVRNLDPDQVSALTRQVAANLEEPDAR